MKITKDPNKPDQFKINKINANKGCDKCPNCGETKSLWEYAKDRSPLSGGVESWPYDFREGFLFSKSMRIDKYKCHTCGCELESDPYQWC